MPLERKKKMNFGWIDPDLLRDFQAEGTDAHRLCTIDNGWVERFGRDVLISFKRVLIRERLVEERAILGRFCRLPRSTGVCAVHPPKK